MNTNAATTIATLTENERTALALWIEIDAIETKIETRTATRADVLRLNDAIDAFDAFGEDVAQTAMRAAWAGVR